MKEATSQERELWQSYRKDGSSLTQEEIINMYLDKTKTVAASLYMKRPNNTVDFSDYYHYAIVGLLEAIRNYKIEKNDNFFAYAKIRITGSILDGISTMTEKALQIKARHRYQQRLDSINDKNFSDKDLFQDFLGLSISLAIGFILDAENKGDESYYSTSEHSDIREILKYCLDNLEADERSVILYHYYYEVEFRSIAEMLNLSRSRIAQLHKRGIENIRKIYEQAVEFDVSY